MPKSKSKREASSSDSDSGPEDRGPVKKKPAPSKPAEKSGKSSGKSSGKVDEEPSWDLGNKKFVKVSEWNGRVMISVREYYEKDGELLPGRKGITLNVENYKKLKACLEDVDEALAKF